MADKEGTKLISEIFVISQVPCVCKTGPGMIPIPYQIISKFDKAVATATTVNFTGNPVFNSESFISTCIGNEPGTGGGIVSGVNKGASRPTDWSRTVRVQEGKGVVRHDDPFVMNCAGPKGPSNTIGKVLYIKFVQIAKVNPDGTIEVERKGEWNDSEGNVHSLESTEKYDAQGNLKEAKTEIKSDYKDKTPVDIEGQPLGNNAIGKQDELGRTYAGDGMYGRPVDNSFSPNIKDTNPIVIPETAEEKSWFGSVWDQATEVANDAWEGAKSLNKTYKITERGLGVVQVVGSGFEIVAGAVGVVAPEPITTVAGGAAIVHGTDSAIAGFRQIWTGEIKETFIEQGSKALVTNLGGSSQLANGVATAVDTGLGMINPANLGKKALSEGMEGIVTEGGERLLKESSENIAKKGSKAIPGKGGTKITKKVPNPKSVKQFGHTFNTHGAGKKNTNKLRGRAAKTGEDQGQWLDNQKAADFLSQYDDITSPKIVDLPKGMGQVIKPDGSIVNATKAQLVPKPGGGFRTAFPKQ